MGTVLRNRGKRGWVSCLDQVIWGWGREIRLVGIM